MEIRDGKIGEQYDHNLDDAEPVEDEEEDEGKDNVKSPAAVQVMEGAVGRCVQGRRENNIVDSIVAVAQDKVKGENAEEGGDVIAEAGVLRI